MIFPWGGGGIFWKGTFMWDNILERDRQWLKAMCVADIPRMYRGVWGYTAQKMFEIWNPEMPFPAFWASKFASKCFSNCTCIWNKRRKKRTKVKKKYLLEGDSNGHVCGDILPRKCLKFETRKCYFLDSEHPNLLYLHYLLEGDSKGHVCGDILPWKCLKFETRNAISWILSIQICSKIYATNPTILVFEIKEGKNAPEI
jgi:hypothetical protein